jgi:hypothetical protein
MAAWPPHRLEAIVLVLDLDVVLDLLLVVVVPDQPRVLLAQRTQLRLALRALDHQRLRRRVRRMRQPEGMT